MDFFSNAIYNLLTKMWRIDLPLRHETAGILIPSIFGFDIYGEMPQNTKEVTAYPGGSI
jgi:hypothetical protein